MNEEREQLYEAITAIIGPAPFVLIWDSTPLEELADDQRDLISYVAPPHQASYTSQGLCQAGADAWRIRTETY